MLDLGYNNTYAKKIFILAKSVKVTTAPRQSAEILVDDVQEALRRRQPQRNLRSIRDQRIMRSFHLMIMSFLSSMRL